MTSTSTNVALIRPGPPASRSDLPEAMRFEPWNTAPTAAERLFYAVVSPTALFWRGGSRRAAVSIDLVRRCCRHFTSQPKSPQPAALFRIPFLPVLVESRSGIAWLSSTSAASEFGTVGLPAGSYRYRALDLFGKVTLRGNYVGQGTSGEQAVYLGTKLELDEPDSRQVMGFVRWESGMPVRKAEVYMQHAGNFRRFLRRVETDESGFFHFAGMPGGEPYFVFALPPGERTHLRNSIASVCRSTFARCGGS